MNVKGAGISYVSDYQSQDSKVFRGGLKHVPEGQQFLTYGTKNSVHTYHDKMQYERGWIQHSRSPHNQYLAFHYMYGGIRTWLIQRHLINTIYRKNLRHWWGPALLSFIIGSIGMRIYDNGAYDYFYFIE